MAGHDIKYLTLIERSKSGKGQVIYVAMTIRNGMKLKELLTNTFMTKIQEEWNQVFYGKHGEENLKEYVYSKHGIKEFSMRDIVCGLNVKKNVDFVEKTVSPLDGVELITHVAETASSVVIPFEQFLPLVKKVTDILNKDYDSSITLLSFTLTVDFKNNSEKEDKILKEDIEELLKFQAALAESIEVVGKKISHVDETISGASDKVNLVIKKVNYEEANEPPRSDRLRKYVYVKTKEDVAFKRVDKGNYNTVKNQVTILKKLKDCQNIIHFYRLTKNDKDDFYLVTEWAEYKNLREYITSNGQNIEVKLRIKFAYDIAKGLNFLNSVKLVEKNENNKRNTEEEAKKNMIPNVKITVLVFFFGKLVNVEFLKYNALVNKAVDQNPGLRPILVQDIFNNYIKHTVSRSGTLNSDTIAATDEDFVIDFNKAADYGDEYPDAQLLRYATLVMQGKGVESNTEEALNYFVKAAKNDHLVAMFNVSTYYFSQSDVELGRYYMMMPLVKIMSKQLGIAKITASRMRSDLIKFRSTN
ncbi:3952_t:CDS:10 [Funneliformis geosporum]|nr:3952_t:CDS:10 [Funneliformis geosporum]